MRWRYAKKYILKEYDLPLIEFTVKTDEFGRISVRINEVDDSKKHLFPYLLLPEVSNERLESWLRGRTIPKNRKFVTELLMQVGLTINDTMGIIELCKGLSVNDAYWIDDLSEQVTFDEINLYENQLDETPAYIAYTGYTITKAR